MEIVSLNVYILVFHTVSGSSFSEKIFRKFVYFILLDSTVFLWKKSYVIVSYVSEWF